MTIVLYLHLNMYLCMRSHELPLGCNTETPYQNCDKNSQLVVIGAWVSKSVLTNWAFFYECIFVCKCVSC